MRGSGAWVSARRGSRETSLSSNAGQGQLPHSCLKSRSRSTAAASSSSRACRSAPCETFSFRPREKRSKPAALRSWGWAAFGQGAARPAIAVPDRGQALRLQRQSARAPGHPRPRLRHRSRADLLHPPLRADTHQGHLRHCPARLAAGRHRRFGLRHQPLAESRPQLHFHGKRRSYLSASCPAPKGFPGAAFPFARASFGFGKQTLTSTLTRSCRVS
jgi:hypothetical protein